MKDESPIERHSPLIVTTLPGRTAKELKSQLKLAGAGGADLVEFRLDRLSPGELPLLTGIHNIPMEYEWVPAIATLRSKAEGGEGPDDPSERLAVIKEALETTPFTYVDLEVARDKGISKELRQSFGRSMGRIFSAHLGKNWTVEDVRTAMKDSLNAGDIAKVVVPSDVGRAIRDLIPLAHTLKGEPFVIHTTGPSGPLLRVLSQQLHMALVYCSLDGESVRSVEPSQIPQSSLRRYFSSDAYSGWYALLGKPVAHSLSPSIYSTFFSATGTKSVYITLEIENDAEFIQTIKDLPRMGLKGVNVTRPYKEIAAQAATMKAEEVVGSGAANTVTFPGHDGHSVAAFNTDVIALEKILTEMKDKTWSGKELLVLGSGGAARAVALAGHHVGAGVFLMARNTASAEKIVQALGEAAPTLLDTRSVRRFELVVNATPGGQVDRKPLELPLKDAICSGGTLLDLVYYPVDDSLRVAASGIGCRYIGGGRMLVYQAAESFRRFTGESPPESVVSEMVERIS